MKIQYHLNYSTCGNNFNVNHLRKNVSICSSNDVSLILPHISTIYRLTIDPPNDQLPFGLTAELVEPAPFRPEFFGLTFAITLVG